MNLMHNVYQEYFDKFVWVFLDVILIYYRNEKEHNHHLRLSLKVSRKNQLYEKLSKCEFYISQIEYLGNIISTNGIAVDPNKV